jgi:hypothetical protein
MWYGDVMIAGEELQNVSQHQVEHLHFKGLRQKFIGNHNGPKT